MPFWKKPEKKMLTKEDLLVDKRLLEMKEKEQRIKITKIDSEIKRLFESGIDKSREEKKIIFRQIHRLQLKKNRMSNGLKIIDKMIVTADKFINKMDEKRLWNELAELEVSKHIQGISIKELEIFIQDMNRQNAKLNVAIDGINDVMLDPIPMEDEVGSEMEQKILEAWDKVERGEDLDKTLQSYERELAPDQDELNFEMV